MGESKYIVRVSCRTYNHAPYIKDALTGFCMQETSFPFVCTIIDDASTDGEPEVIKQYLSDHFDLEDKMVVRDEETDDYFLTFAQHKTNNNCFFVVLFLKYNHYSKKKTIRPYIEEWCNTKYVALCEGDDYWIDPKKIEKQVEYLEHNQNVSMCFHSAYEIDEEKEKKVLFSNIEDRYYSDVEIFSKFIVPTASVVFKAKVLSSPLLFKFIQDNRINVGDLSIWLSCCREGYVRGFSGVMSVYRRHGGSWTRNNNSKKQMAGAYRQEAIMQIYGSNLKKIGKKKYISFAVSAYLLSVKEGKPCYKYLVSTFFKYPRETLLLLFKYFVRHKDDIKRVKQNTADIKNNRDVVGKINVN